MRCFSKVGVVQLGEFKTTINDGSCTPYEVFKAGQLLHMKCGV